MTEVIPTVKNFYKSFRKWKDNTAFNYTVSINPLDGNLGRDRFVWEQGFPSNYKGYGAERLWLCVNLRWVHSVGVRGQKETEYDHGTLTAFCLVLLFLCMYSICCVHDDRKLRRPDFWCCVVCCGCNFLCICSQTNWMWDGFPVFLFLIMILRLWYVFLLFKSSHIRKSNS